MTEELKLERTGFGDMRRIVRGRTVVATAQQTQTGSGVLTPQPMPSG